MSGTIGPAEVARDLVNRLDSTEPAWRGPAPERRLRLLQKAASYFAAVSRRCCIPDADFVPAPGRAVQQVRCDHHF